jgi:hypothetical protein
MPRLCRGRSDGQRRIEIVVDAFVGECDIQQIIRIVSTFRRLKIRFTSRASGSSRRRDRLTGTATRTDNTCRCHPASAESSSPFSPHAVSLDCCFCLSSTSMHARARTGTRRRSSIATSTRTIRRHTASHWNTAATATTSDGYRFPLRIPIELHTSIRPLRWSRISFQRVSRR